MRKRLSKNDLLEVARPSGVLTDNEIEEIRQAYSDGCKGEILIGLRWEERVITMLLPTQVDSQLPKSLAQLMQAGCNRCICISKNTSP